MTFMLLRRLSDGKYLSSFVNTFIPWHFEADIRNAIMYDHEGHALNLAREFTETYSIPCEVVYATITISNVRD